MEAFKLGKQRGLKDPPPAPPSSPPQNRSLNLMDSKQYEKKIEMLERATLGCMALPKRPKDKPDLDMISKGLTVVNNFCDDCVPRHELCDLGVIPILTQLLH